MKAVVLFAFGTATYMVVRRWNQLGGKGIPEPNVIAPTAYLYGILALAVDIVGGAAVFAAVALTFGLIYALQDIGTPAEQNSILSRTMGKTLTPAINTPSRAAANVRNQRANASRTNPANYVANPRAGTGVGQRPG